MRARRSWLNTAIRVFAIFSRPKRRRWAKRGIARFAQAAGEWLAFLDQDDIWLPHKLEQQMALAAGGVGIIYGRAVLFDSRRGNLRDYDYAHEFEPLPEGDIFAELFSERLLYRHEFGGAAALGSRGSGRHSGLDPGCSRLLSLRRDCPPLSVPGRCRTLSAGIAFTRAACRLRDRTGCGCIASRCRS